MNTISCYKVKSSNDVAQISAWIENIIGRSKFIWPQNSGNNSWPNHEGYTPHKIQQKNKWVTC